MNKFINVFSSFFKLLFMISLTVFLSVSFYQSIDYADYVSKSMYAMNQERGDIYFNLILKNSSLSESDIPYHPLACQQVFKEEEKKIESYDYSFVSFLPKKTPSKWTYLLDSGPKSPGDGEAIITRNLARVCGLEQTEILGKEFGLWDSEKKFKVVNVIDTNDEFAYRYPGLGYISYDNCSYLSNCLFIEERFYLENVGFQNCYVADFHSPKEIKRVEEQGDFDIKSYNAVYNGFYPFWRRRNIVKVYSFSCFFASIITLLVFDLTKQDFSAKTLKWSLMTDGIGFLASVLIIITVVCILTGVFGLYAQLFNHLFITLFALIPTVILLIMDVCFFLAKRKPVLYF